MKHLLTRRTIRRYADKDIPDALLSRLLTEAARTQTMGNLQLYSVVVTRSQEMKERLAPAHFNQPMVTGAPVVLTICADFNRTSVWAENRQAVPGYANFLSFINAATDALLYTQTLCNLFDEEGLGYCYLGTTVYQPQSIIDTLQLPRLTMPVATLTVGWPAEEPPLSDRLPLASFVHQETYHDYTPQDIDTYYHAKEQLEENRHFVEINHKETLAQIFTDIRYTKKDNEAMSEGLLNALRKQGFLTVKDIRLIIFDFDGTIGDTRRNVVVTMQQTLEQMGLPVCTEEACAATIGLPLEECFRRVVPGITEEKVMECAATYRRIFEINKEKMCPQAFPHVAETLAELHRRGFRMSVATSRGVDSARDLLTGMGLIQYFDYLLGAESVTKHKPDPEPVLKTLRDLGEDAAHALVVGDMPVDILMGSRAGCKTCGVTYGNATREELQEADADHIIDDFAALLEHIG